MARWTLSLTMQLVLLAYFVDGQMKEPCQMKQGNTTDIIRFPFIASIHYRDGDLNVPFCCGSVVNSRWILTAGQCLVQTNNFAVLKDKDKMIVSMGLTVMSSFINADNRDTVFRPDHLVVHPKLLKWFPQYDIGLIRLERKVRLGVRIAKAPMLPPKLRRNFDPSTSTTCTVVSWGISGQADKRRIHKRWDYGDQPLKYFQVTRVAPDACERGLPLGAEKFILCTVCKGRSQAPCMGDIGAPVMCDGHQVGVMSWSRDCNAADTPVVLTRIDALQEWVDYQIHGNGAQRQPTSFFWVLLVTVNVAL